MSSERKWLFRVQHILDAIKKIESYCEGMSEQQFSADPRTIDAVIRNFEVIGEASRQIPTEIRKQYSSVPWDVMQGMRHILIHTYDMVRLDIVWRTIQEDLPGLKSQVQAILDALEPSK